ncbi:hypothetical protein ACSLFT_18115 [Streptomyces sp. G6]
MLTAHGPARLPGTTDPTVTTVPALTTVPVPDLVPLLPVHVRGTGLRRDPHRSGRSRRFVRPYGPDAPRPRSRAPGPLRARLHGSS